MEVKSKKSGRRDNGKAEIMESRNAKKKNQKKNGIDTSKN